jgi:hypothetical protein
VPREQRNERQRCHKLCSSTAAIAALWAVYGIVTTYVFYQAMEPLKRELIGVLGGFGLVLVVGTALLFLPKRRNRMSDKDQA